VQRKVALRITMAYRTVSTDAARVLAGTVPIELLIEERAAERTDGGNKADRRSKTMEKWQRQWETSRVGAWTRELIPDIDAWTRRKHGQLTHHMTQMLTGHGSFGQYRHRIRKIETAICQYCKAEDDTAEHTMTRSDFV
jgi:hypothetical protein